MLRKEKKYKTTELFVGIIAKQGEAKMYGSSVLDFGCKWTYDNFDVGIFVKKKIGYCRISTNSIYPVSNSDTEYKIVINRTCFENLALAYPEIAKEFPSLTKQQIIDLEKTICDATFNNKNKNAETTLEK